jgi:hypothetical protein
METSSVNMFDRHQLAVQQQQGGTDYLGRAASSSRADEAAVKLFANGPARKAMEEKLLSTGMAVEDLYMLLFGGGLQSITRSGWVSSLTAHRRQT